jgi:hypothetical protein
LTPGNVDNSDPYQKTYQTIYQTRNRKKLINTT